MTFAARLAAMRPDERLRRALDAWALRGGMAYLIFCLCVGALALLAGASRRSPIPDARG